MSGISLGDKGTAWVVDVVGRVWFTTGVRWDTPCGSGQWWQVGNHSVLFKKMYRKSDSHYEYFNERCNYIRHSPKVMATVRTTCVWRLCG